jgi:hypothetical protein
VRHQVANNFPGIPVPDHRADRHFNNNVCPAFTGTPLSGSPGAVAGLEMPLMPILHQAAGIFIGFHNNIAAAAAVTTVRTAPRHKLLPPEARRTAAAVAALNFYFSLINQLEYPFSGRQIPVTTIS